METDSPVPQDVMGAVDDDRFLIADVSRDDAWLSIGRAEAPVLSAYR
jgi:hypothetical protein